MSKVKCGIPQGTVLGPLFFIVFISGLPEQVISDVILFADDAKICRQIKDKRDKLHLQ